MGLPAWAGSAALPKPPPVHVPIRTGFRSLYLPTNTALGGGLRKRKRSGRAAKPSTARAEPHSRLFASAGYLQSRVRLAIA